MAWLIRFDFPGFNEPLYASLTPARKNDLPQWNYGNLSSAHRWDDEQHARSAVHNCYGSISALYAQVICEEVSRV